MRELYAQTVRVRCIPMIRVLVLSAGGPAGVNFIKALQISGIKIDYLSIGVFGADSNPYHLILSEKHTVKSFLIPTCDKMGYIHAINEIIDKYDIDFVHAQSDAEVNVISMNRGNINAKVFLPDRHIIKTCQDKWYTSAIWSKNFKNTKSYLLKDNDDYCETLTTIFNEYNFVWLRATRGAGGRASALCKNIDVAYYWLRYWWSLDPTMEFMAQEYLPGRNIAWQSVWKDGQLLTSQARERVEYIYPNLTPSGITGTPSVQRTLNEDKINLFAIRAIKDIDTKPNGIYSVDLKEDIRGRPIPTEINAGRFFTTSYFFAYAGQMFNSPRANMPLIYVLAAMDKKIPHGSLTNVLDKDIYWIRHIDCGHKLTKEDCIR